MRVLWSYDLPGTGDGERRPIGTGTPLHWDGRHVLLPVSEYEYPGEIRAAEPAKRGYRLDLHRVTPHGEGTVVSLRLASCLIAQNWSFLQLGADLLLHTGSFHSVTTGEQVPELPFVDACHGSGRGIFLQRDGRLFFADVRRPVIHCHDLRTKAPVWNITVPSKQPYGAGPIAVHDGHLVCHAHDALTYLDPATGKIERQQTVPRIDKLFAPVRYHDHLLFPFTNWTSGGLLRFDPVQEKVIWKFAKRGGSAPPPGGRLPVIGQTAIISVNGGSSLVGVDLESGQARWTFRAQWLYTPIEVCDRSIIFGTSGGHGRHLRRHDAETGETEWAVQLDGGCPYYASEGEHLVAGDWSGVLRRVQRADGKVIDQQKLGAPLTGPPLVVGSCVYMVRWPTDGTRPSLVAVETRP